MQDHSVKCNAEGKDRVKLTPKDLGFAFDHTAALWLRSARSESRGLNIAPFLEIGTAHITRAGGGVDAMQAQIEVLCNRMTIFGNPFHLREDESCRESVCNAHEVYLKHLRALTEKSQTQTLAELAKDVAEELGFDKFKFSKDWLVEFGSKAAAEWTSAFEALAAFAESKRSERVTIRLICHCVPKRCHTEALCSLLHERVESAEPYSSRRIASLTKEEQRLANPPPWGDSWGCAGVVALATVESNSSLEELQVCLVEKRDGRLGFPKGSAEPTDTSAQVTALREWVEETNLPASVVCLKEDCSPISDGRSCLYFVASANLHSLQDNTHGPQSSQPVLWQVKDDDCDPNPIVLAQWIPVQQALKHERLNEARRIILRSAVQLLQTTRPSTIRADLRPSTGPKTRRWKSLSAA